MTEEQLYHKIEAYLFGELPPEEAEAFARQIGEDPALARQVELHRLEHDAMEVLLERELRENLQEWTRTAKKGAEPVNGPGLPAAEQVKRPRIIPLRRLLWLAAILAGAIFAGIGIIWQPWAVSPPVAIEQEEAPPPEHISPSPAPALPSEEPAPEPGQPLPSTSGQEQETPEPPRQVGPELLALANEAFNDPFSGDQVRGEPPAASGEAGPFAAAVAAYKAGRYERARQLAAEVPASEASYGDARLLIGRSLYRQGRYEEAATVFHGILDDEAIAPEDELLQKLARQTAEWNLMATYLAQGPPMLPAANRLLEKMLNEEQHLFGQKAGRLKVKLNELME